MLHKRLSLLLVIITLLCLLCACGGQGEAQTTTASDTQTSASATSATETSASAALTEVNIVEAGKPIFKLIRDEDAASDSSDVAQARVLADTVKELTGVSLSLGTDWIKRGTEHDASTYEILIGNTNYAETAQVAEAIGYGDWALQLIGNKIVVFGYDAAGLAKATSALESLLRKGVSEDGKTLTLSVETLQDGGTVNAQLSALPNYEGGKFSAYYEAGHKCEEVIIKDTELAHFQSYLKTLEGAGYQCYTSHQITDNHFATYTNDKYTVNVGFYKYENAARLLIEPLAPAVPRAEDNKYTAITTSQITMLGQGYTASNGDYKGNGLSVLIRLTDGRFIVVDGGHGMDSVANELVKELREQSKAYAKTDKEITIAAWIVTHAHGDHYGALLSKTDFFKGFTVERILFNYLSENERNRCRIVHVDAWESNDGANGYVNTVGVAKKLGAQMQSLHVGQVWHIADLEMEVLYTIESYAPDAANAMNTTSNVIRMQFGGENGTVYMSTGDATGHGMEICTKMYGEYLKSDIVQVCHHGYTTWGNNNGMIRAYEKINAPTVLWPQGGKAFPNYKDKAYNIVLFQVPAYQECYVSGEIGEKIIVPIPYTVGAATQSRVG